MPEITRSANLFVIFFMRNTRRMVVTFFDYIRAMAQDPKTIRFNTTETPNRLKRFEDAIKKAAADGGEVIRQLTDAYCLYVEENGHSPVFPVRLVSAIVEKSAKTKRGPKKQD